MQAVNGQGKTSLSKNSVISQSSKESSTSSDKTRDSKPTRSENSTILVIASSTHHTINTLKYKIVKKRRENSDEVRNKTINNTTNENKQPVVSGRERVGNFISFDIKVQFLYSPKTFLC